MRILLPLSLLALSACASGGSGPAPQQQSRRPTVAGTSTGYEIVADRQAPLEAKTVSAAPGVAWTAVARAYADLGIEVAASDASALTVSSPELQLRQSYLRQPLGNWLECGTSNTGRLANVYQVRLRLSTTTAAAPSGGSALTTSVVATARNPGSSSAPVRCSTTGKLEELVHGRVSEIVGG